MIDSAGPASRDPFRGSIARWQAFLHGGARAMGGKISGVVEKIAAIESN